MLGYGSLLYIFPLTYIHPLRNPQNPCWDTLEYFGDLSKNDTTNILDFYILLKNSLSQSEATELSGTVASLSFNSPSKSGNTLFGMCSQHVLAATQLLAWDQRIQVAKNNFMWVVSTHRESDDVLRSSNCILQSPTGFHGVLMESLWSPHGVLMDSSWTPHGLHEDSSWIPHRVHPKSTDSMESPWILGGLW